MRQQNTKVLALATYEDHLPFLSLPYKSGTVEPRMCAACGHVSHQVLYVPMKCPSCFSVTNILHIPVVIQLITVEIKAEADSPDQANQTILVYGN